jgi:hypothetical protein
MTDGKSADRSARISSGVIGKERHRRTAATGLAVLLVSAEGTLRRKGR